jgi:hypothetical protein
MSKKLGLDDGLIPEAKPGNHKTKKEAVTKALKENILRRKQKKIIDLFGSVVYEEDYDYKKLRIRK